MLITGIISDIKGEKNHDFLKVLQPANICILKRELDLLRVIASSNSKGNKLGLNRSKDRKQCKNKPGTQTKSKHP